MRIRITEVLEDEYVPARSLRCIRAHIAVEGREGKSYDRDLLFGRKLYDEMGRLKESQDWFDPDDMPHDTIIQTGDGGTPSGLVPLSSTLLS